MRGVVVLLILIFCISGRVYPQSDSIKKKTEYFSIAGEGYFPTTTKIASDGNRNPLEYYRMPGFSLGGDYRRVSRGGFTIVTGLHYRKLPISFQYTVRPTDYDGPPEWKTDHFDRFANLSFGHVYVPLQFGYTVQSASKRWIPSFMAGLNFNHLLSYISEYDSTLGDPGERIHLFEFELTSPDNDNRVWTTYIANATVTRTLRGGNQFYIGLVANISTTTVYNGRYAFFFKDGIQTGSYTDKGSYVGLHFGYSFLRKAK
ncbi:MAG: hypothetical protein WC220_01655 [Pedobacter sp.]